MRDETRMLLESVGRLFEEMVVLLEQGHELDREGYAKNGPDRCFHSKPAFRQRATHCDIQCERLDVARWRDDHGLLMELRRVGCGRHPHLLERGDLHRHPDRYR